MKCFERVIKDILLDETRNAVNPFQFAYRAHRVDDAIITLLHNIYGHLDNCKSYVRTLFIDFSSAFDSIRPQSLVYKLQHLKANPHLALWITDCICIAATTEGQIFRYMCTSSDVTHLSAGVPQGCVLSPLLFSLFTSDSNSKNSFSIMIKYADDTALTGLIFDNDESEYRSEVNQFVNWCERNY